MKRFTAICWLLALLALVPGRGVGSIDERFGILDGREAAAPAGSENEAAPPGTPVRESQYAPDREVRITHLKLDVTPDFASRSIEGKVQLTCEVAGRPTQAMRFDAIDLQVRSVTASATLRGYQSTTESLVVTFEKPLPTGTQVTIFAEYSASPREGLYFRTPEMGYRDGDTHLFTQGESIEARHWYPCLDAPNQMFTSEIVCRVPQGMVVISNGRLVSEEPGRTANGSNVVAFHWSQEQPHANYLITLVAGFFGKIEDSYRGIPLAFYTPPSQIEYARPSFENTGPMMEFFEREIGVAYPWPKYYQVCVNDFVAGGMENTSATTLTDTTLFTPDSENIHSSDGLVAHELAHQWFGDLVTCKDWTHIWLNEGFATYYEALYEADRHGRDAFLYGMHQSLRQITSVANDTQPIVRRDFTRPGEMFGYLSYSKAAWVLHMLRADLGQDLYRECVRSFLDRFRHQNVVTEDFRKIIEERSHRNFDRFFDQWLYHGHHPRLEVGYSWNELSRLATITIRQTQAVSEQVMIFEFPLTVRFKGAFGVTNSVLKVTRKDQEFSIPLGSAPSVVRIDPELSLLCEMNLNLPVGMIQAQMEDQTDVLGRLMAVERFAKRRDQEAVKQLGRILREDPCYGLRLEASKALRAIHNDEALQVLVSCTAQADARVRRQVLLDIGGFFDSVALETLRLAIEKEPNPAVVSAAIGGVAGYPDAGVPPLLLKALSRPSFENEISLAAIQAMSKHRDAAFIEPIVQFLSTNKASFPRHGLSRALSALAQLSKDEKDKDPVYRFLLDQVSSEKGLTRLSALNALGVLGDLRAIAVLEKYSTAAKDSSEYRAAERALGQLRAVPKAPPAETGNLRQELLDLKREHRELKDYLEATRKLLKEKIPDSAAEKGRATKRVSRLARSDALLKSPKAR